MDEKTVVIIVMGSIVIAMGLFATYIESRQHAQDEAPKRAQPQRLRVHRHTRRKLAD